MSRFIQSNDEKQRNALKYGDIAVDKFKSCIPESEMIEYSNNSDTCKYKNDKFKITANWNGQITVTKFTDGEKTTMIAKINNIGEIHKIVVIDPELPVSSWLVLPKKCCNWEYLYGVSSEIVEFDEYIPYLDYKEHE